MEIAAEVRRVRPNQALQRSVQVGRFAPLLPARGAPPSADEIIDDGWSAKDTPIDDDYAMTSVGSLD